METVDYICLWIGRIIVIFIFITSIMNVILTYRKGCEAVERERDEREWGK